MNTHHIRLLSPAIDFAAKSTPIYTPDFSPAIHNASVADFAKRLQFRKITHADMPQIWNILKNESGQTTDFSYGGLLMWVDLFHYEFAILNDTLFILGRVEDDLSKVAFSMPVGRMPLAMCIEILRQYSRNNNLDLIFSAVPEYALEEFKNLNPTEITPLSDWSDYLYEADKLCSLSGKKLGKKRNHINQFLAAYPDWKYEEISTENTNELLKFMDKIDEEGDDTPMAATERSLNRRMLQFIANADPQMTGLLLRDGEGEILAFSIGDIKGDTLFVHIEKALRNAPGAFEMINKTFAAITCEQHPEIRFINREDDSGDPGLRQAKLSYHPCDMLKKYNIKFI